MLTLENDLLEDLTAELSATDPKFNQALIIPKIKNAIREVRRARNYPKYYTESMIMDDLQDYYVNMRKLALYDYNKIGGEFEDSHGESGTNRSFSKRSDCFSGIVKLSRC